MRFYKLRVTPNAANIASTFNEQFKPEIISEFNDPFRVDWITSPSEEFFVGEKVSCNSKSCSLSRLTDHSCWLGLATVGPC